MAELGNTLSRTRRARGITLEDAERDTHVSKRYLLALENEDFTVFPAPVYARGFLRTYSRYLGLNPEELVRVFPNGDLNVDMTPLPTVVQPQQQLVNVNWIVAGIVMIFLFGAGALLLSGGGDDPSVVANAPRQTVVPGATNQAQNNNTTGQLPQQQPTVTVPGKTIAQAAPGRLPDFVGADLPSSLTLLSSNQIDYAIIGAPSQTVPKGIVISQAPSPGSRSDDGATITLVVSSGPPG
jgi:hypothetical protein